MLIICCLDACEYREEMCHTPVSQHVQQIYFAGIHIEIIHDFYSKSVILIILILNVHFVYLFILFIFIVTYFVVSV